MCRNLFTLCMVAGSLDSFSNEGHIMGGVCYFFAFFETSILVFDFFINFSFSMHSCVFYVRGKKRSVKFQRNLSEWERHVEQE